VNLSGDPAQDFFGDVIAEEVLTELAHLRWLLVIARNSSFIFRGTTVDVREIGRQLDVRDVLEGSARHSNGRLRVACRLVDARNALQVWSARYDRKFTDVFDVQDEITAAVLAALGPAIIDAERKRIARQAPESLSAWESYQRGVWHMLKQTVDDNRRARQFFQQAITLETDYSPGYDGLAWTHLMESSTFSRISIAEGCKRSEPLARKAVELDPENAEARARLALTVYLTGESRAAIAEAERALSISPNCADACGVRGAALVFSGERKAGRASLERYLRLSPRDPARPIRMAQIAASYYFEENYDRAAQVARRTILEYPTIPIAYRWLAASLGQLGQTAEGAKVIDELSRMCASSIDMYVNRRPPQHRQDDYDHMMEGLAKAGRTGAGANRR
jgi:adenylate cyclase